ncbi:hypothetical protein AAFP30_00070 [Gordonia sp. CPCC 205515]|uniref:hypothetical protein n=1 Tax=Gordonia sp. CPCC 205515 TaxID=3140791 RepID=UPI003AF3C37A
MTQKVMAAIWGTDLSTILLDGSLTKALHDAGTTRLQVNINDTAVDGAMRINELDPPIDAVVSLWCSDPQAALTVLTSRVPKVAAWAVTERVPLDPALPADGTRIDALSNIAFLRRPADLEYDEWRRIWLDDHTQVAIDTQATFGYYQNVVDEPLTAVTPHVDAIVEELFPMAAITDMHAFYGSGGDQSELERRMTAMLESVMRFGAERNLDLVPTSRYDRIL